MHIARMPDTVSLSRATTLVPFLNLLDELGAPVDRALEQGHLPLHLREMPGCFIATKLNWDFVGRMARQEDIDDLGLRVGYQAGVSLLGRSLFARVRRSRNLARALQTFCKNASRESTGMSCWVTTDESQVELHLKKAFGPTTRGYRQTEWLGLMAMLGVVQLFMGPSWEPTSIALRSVGPVPDLAHKLSRQHAPTGPGTDRACIPKKRSTIRAARPTARPVSNGPQVGSRNLRESPAEGLFGALAQSLEPYLADAYPDVTLGARIADMSVRTLQRRLHIEGATYSNVVDQARFQIASKELATSARPSKEIAEALGTRTPPTSRGLFDGSPD